MRLSRNTVRKYRAVAAGRGWLARDIVQPLENSLSVADRKNVESGNL